MLASVVIAHGLKGRDSRLESELRRVLFVMRRFVKFGVLLAESGRVLGESCEGLFVVVFDSFEGDSG